MFISELNHPMFNLFDLSSLRTGIMAGALCHIETMNNVMDENGYFRVTGRIKDMIIRGGKNIYPREIENFLYPHPEIEAVEGVGVASENQGEEVGAFIKRKAASQLKEEDVIDYCRGQIARFKIPKYIFFVNEFPMTASGKIQKYKLREMALALVK